MARDNNSPSRDEELGEEGDLELASRYRAPALERGLDVLEALSDVELGITRAALAESIGVSSEPNLSNAGTVSKAQIHCFGPAQQPLFADVAALRAGTPPSANAAADGSGPADHAGGRDQLAPIDPPLGIR